MYHYVSKINIFSDCHLIEDCLKAITPLDRFEHHIQTHSSVSHEVLVESDMILLELPFNQDEVRQIWQIKKPGALLVLCITAEKMDELSSEILKVVDDIWIVPLREELIGFYFTKLLKQQKLVKDYSLYRNYLETIINSIPDLVWFKDVKGAHLIVNDSFCNTVDKPKDDVIGRGHCYIWNIDEKEYATGEYVCLETDEIVLEKRETCLFEEKVLSKEGMRLFKTYKSPIFDDDCKVIGTVGVAHDVTDIKNNYAELEIIIENIPFGILVYDKKGFILSANKRLTDYMGIDKESLVGINFEALECNMQRVKDRVARAGIKNNSYKTKIMINNEERVLEIHKEPLRDALNNVSGYMCVFRDITLIHQFHERNLLNANTDYLTGLYNRRYLYEFLGIKRKINPTSLFCIDIDNFKVVNDTYGHKAGDNALVFLSNILLEQFPKQQIFRLGGDEFLVAIIDNSSKEQIEKYAEDLLDIVNERIIEVDEMRLMSVSIGVVVDEESTVDLDELLKRGDLALYMAKKAGKNRYCFWEKDMEK